MAPRSSYIIGTVIVIFCPFLLPALDSQLDPPDTRSYYHHACSNCMSQHPSHGEPKEADELRLNSIKQQILSKLGLKKEPNITSPPIPKEVVWQTLSRADGTRDFLETTHSPEPEDDFYGRTSEIITFAEPGQSINGQSLIEFTHAQENEGELRVKSASLWVKVDFKSWVAQNMRLLLSDKKITLYVFNVKPRRTANTTRLSGMDFQMELATSIALTFGTLGWKRFDVTSIVQKWYSVPSSREKLKLLVDCSGCCGLVETVLFQRRDDTSHRPFLVLHTDPVVTRRVRRRALECSENMRKCCKKRFFVSFKQLGWDNWIIAPEGYFANYCRGDCDRTPDTFLNYYTTVIEEYRKVDKMAEIRPCCAPTKFSSMSLIYFDPDENIIKRDLPKMVVDECGCP